MTRKHVFAGAVLSLLSASAWAATYTGNIVMLEVWKNGNVAFSITPVPSACNNQFILNFSDPGTKNQYATLLAAKSRGSQVTVYTNPTCVVAENFPSAGAVYNETLYLYALD